MKLTKFLSLIGIAVLMSSCSSQSNTETFWVAGVKSECDMGAGKGECLNTYKGNYLNQADWKLFYNNIEGFTFKEGEAQQITVSKTNIKNPPADGSSIAYSLEKVLQTIPDTRVGAQGSWIIGAINDKPVNTKENLPTIMLSLTEKKISGTDGCNQYFGPIENMTTEFITLGTIAQTKRMCVDMEIPSAFNNALSNVKKWSVQNGRLILLDNNDQALLSFLQYDNPGSDINASWTAVRINGNPINRMVTAPVVNFQLDNMRVTGNNSCNDFVGTLDNIDSRNLKLNGLVNTEKMCKDMTTANAFNKALESATSYTIKGNQLSLLDASGNEVAAFIKN